VDESEVAEDVSTVGMADAYYWHGHFGAEDIGHVEEISDVVGPCRWRCLALAHFEELRELTIISKKLFI
jgi:hypothetical protein